MLVGRGYSHTKEAGVSSTTGRVVSSVSSAPSAAGPSTSSACCGGSSGAGGWSDKTSASGALLPPPSFGFALLLLAAALLFFLLLFFFFLLAGEGAGDDETAGRWLINAGELVDLQVTKKTKGEVVMFTGTSTMRKAVAGGREADCPPFESWWAPGCLSLSVTVSVAALPLTTVWATSAWDSGLKFCGNLL
ncbi:hypothetical protein QBC45DRAFT_434625 [Copromyces sp. CBS 386.78]|nr:hypothetical protein QBC45DRAFT_434625 [Copromyces sp. CBS 386.78]